MKILIIALVLKSLDALSTNRPFECYVCNKEPHEDDSQPCIDKIEACQSGVTSCSSVAFKMIDGKMRIRKFCTSPGIPIYQYLMIFPGSSLCQNIETSDTPDPPPPQVSLPGPDGKPQIASPPAPPAKETSTMLCVCTKPKCNGGTYREVMERSMLRNLETHELENAEKPGKKSDLIDDKSANGPAVEFF